MATNNKQLVLGIRREDKNRWERRAPLAPAHVKDLVARGIKVIVQPSSLRTFSDRQYAEAGAVIQDDLSEAQTIICVKEVPQNLLLNDRTYIFFSHTIKAQQVNMPMLDDILRKNIRLIDYELITDKTGNRLVRFGKFAGYAGMIDTFHGLGDRLLALGHSTPFLHVGYSYCYSNLVTAKDAVKEMGEELAHYGLPDELVPMIFLFTSKGNVSQGAQEIFNLLPHKWIKPDEMEDLVKNKEKASPFMVYGVLLTADDYVQPNNKNDKFNKNDYYDHPDRYHSVYYEKYAPYPSVIMNCAYWDYRFPKMLTINQMTELVEQKRNRLLVVGDISCDRMGSIEFLMKTTSIDQPLFVYDPITQECFDSTTDHDYIYKPGVLFCAVDNFPTEFPKEATQYFGDHLLPFLESVIKSDFTKQYSEQKDLPEEVHKAVITCNGRLTPHCEYIMDLRKQNEKSLRSILLLGAGYVSAPVIEYLSRNPKNSITVVDKFIEQAESHCKNKKNCIPKSADVTDPSQLDELMKSNNLVISLLPSALNNIIAEACLRNKKNLITASYISNQMKSMNDQVKKEGLLFLNEIGLDPGIDHLEALRVINNIKQQGGKIRSFVSWCGGLPMPEFSDNPLGYKFSWSPRGVLTAATKDAKYLQDGNIIDINGKKLFKSQQPLNIFPGFNLEGIPNRDSIAYIKEYGIEDTVRTMFRGTLRYRGYSDILEAFVEIGLLNDKQESYLSPDSPDISWNEALRRLLEVPKESKITTRHSLRKRLTADRGYPYKGYSDDRIRRILDCFEWLNLFSDNINVSKKGTWIDSFCDLLSSKLQYDQYERDTVILHHIFGIEWSNGQSEIKTSTMVTHGDKSGSAMARCVGLPVAIAAELILKGVLSSLSGVTGPMTPDIYNPLLKSLSNEGIRFIHKSTPTEYL